MVIPCPWYATRMRPMDWWPAPKDGVCFIQLLVMAHGTWQKPPNYGQDVFKSLLIICEKNNHQKWVWKPNMYGASIIALFSHSILFLLRTADFTQHPWCWGSLICICSTIKDRFNHIHSHPSPDNFPTKGVTRWHMFDATPWKITTDGISPVGD